MVVYRHRRLDNNQVFYVGIGTVKRAKSHNGRSEFWKRIVNKTIYQVEIIAEDLSIEDAKELEILLIEQYGRRDLGLGNLVNLSDGGEGKAGHKHTQEFKDNQAKNMLGNTINKGRKHSSDVNIKKGRKRGECSGADKVEYDGVVYDCKKDLWDCKFNDLCSYSHFNHQIRNNKINIKKL
jgi:hypothetical protein